MRMVLVVLFALVALGAAGVWALGQFGSSLSGGPEVVAEPIVREPEPLPAPAEPQQQAELRSVAPEPTPVPEPTPAEPAKPETPDTEAAPAETADPAKPQVFSRSLEDPAAKVETPAAQDPVAQPAQDSAPAVSAAAAAGVAPTMAQQFKARRVTYNRPPQTLALDKPIDISLVINATDDVDAGKEALQGFPGTIVDRDVDLSDFVAAELSGTDFDIQLQTTAPRQKLSAKIPNQWRWRVTPTKTGEHTLTLTIYGYASGAMDGEPLDSYRDVINVEVKQFDQVVTWARGVQPVFAVVAGLAGALSALFAFLRFREERKRGKPEKSAGS